MLATRHWYTNSPSPLRRVFRGWLKSCVWTVCFPVLSETHRLRCPYSRHGIRRGPSKISSPPCTLRCLNGLDRRPKKAMVASGSRCGRGITVLLVFCFRSCDSSAAENKLSPTPLHYHLLQLYYPLKQIIHPPQRPLDPPRYTHHGPVPASQAKVTFDALS